jgi:hypothetical protein
MAARACPGALPRGHPQNRLAVGGDCREHDQAEVSGTGSPSATRGCHPTGPRLLVWPGPRDASRSALTTHRFGRAARFAEPNHTPRWADRSPPCRSAGWRTGDCCRRHRRSHQAACTSRSRPRRPPGPGRAATSWKPRYCRTGPRSRVERRPGRSGGNTRQRRTRGRLRTLVGRASGRSSGCGCGQEPREQRILLAHVLVSDHGDLGTFPTCGCPFIGGTREEASSCHWPIRDRNAHRTCSRSAEGCGRTGA